MFGQRRLGDSKWFAKLEYRELTFAETLQDASTRRICDRPKNPIVAILSHHAPKNT